ncbi:MAG: penicillin-insensitive murein endopeptidase [Nannocystaceae bacterium]
MVGDGARAWIVQRHAPGAGPELLQGPRLRVGAAANNDVVVDGPGVAARHCTLRCEGPVIRVFDHGAPGGTLVDGSRVAAPAPIDGAVRLLVGAEHVTVRPLAPPLDTSPLRRGFAPRDDRTTRDSHARARDEGDARPRYAGAASPRRARETAGRRRPAPLALTFAALLGAAAVTYALTSARAAENTAAAAVDPNAAGPTIPAAGADSNTDAPRREAATAGPLAAQRGRSQPANEAVRPPPEEEAARPACGAQLEIPGGAASIGGVNFGALDDPLRMPELDLYTLRCPRHAYATATTARALIDAIACFRADREYAGELVVGDISGVNGGPLGPHRSHQSGRDVDLWLPTAAGAYARGCSHCGTDVCRPEPSEVDWSATWGLVEALAEQPAVEVIFLDYALQEELRRAALAAGARPAALDGLLQYPRRGAASLVQHADGHVHHIHVRMRCPEGDARCVDRPAPRHAPRA